ncbi:MULTISPECIES: hypothetical protein [Burkholderia]|uniref:Uncharacterized protein n=1 Tax=Burkholderia paludis TaxID=1506587 RepID=A0A6J5F796_9BURK|nr:MULTISPECIES: hypothetical protein [Burkholderia]CAB3773337.1 hypothetical protein LMG30113_07082 [Burkholderia paludis]VWC45009.1 hypothetical protein BPA30113_07225 [Burkholderia paludis]
MNRMQLVRMQAAATANAEDASLWRWFSALMEEHRIRWCVKGRAWYVSVDNRHVATEGSFDLALRSAHEHAERNGRGAHRDDSGIVETGAHM